MSGGEIQSKWSQSLSASHDNHINKVSPFVNKCLSRAKEGRERIMCKLRAGRGRGYGYSALAAEIMNDLRNETAFTLEEECQLEEELLREISEAIRVEFEDFDHMDFENEESYDAGLYWSDQVEMSEIPEEMLLLCPYCRKAAMTFTECADGVTCSCSVCYNTVVITKDANSSSVSQLREMLASVFERHKQVCNEAKRCLSQSQSTNCSNSADASLRFQQAQNNLNVHCSMCGFSDVLIL